MISFKNPDTAPTFIDNKVSILLSRLTRVRLTGDSKWLARCPAHNDTNPSLAIRIGDNGILIKCFGGCEINAVLAAVGLSFTDLFPDRLNIEYNRTKVKYPKFGRYELFDTIAFEALVLHTALQRLRNGAIFTVAEWGRIDQAMDIIGALSNEVNQ